jgi:hypothetical protein
METEMYATTLKTFTDIEREESGENLLKYADDNKKIA